MSIPERVPAPAPRPLVVACGLLLFLCLVLGTRGFVFGWENNVEELPYLYRLAGVAPYPHDPFVNSCAARFNVLTPYAATLAIPARLLGPGILPPLFFALYLAALAGIYLGIRGILRAISPAGELASAATAGGLYLLGQLAAVIPNRRWLFCHYLDPELVAYCALLLATAAFLQRRIPRAACWLFFGALLHPLATLPVAGAFLVAIGAGTLTPALGVTRRPALGAAAIVAAVVPYSALVWWFARDPADPGGLDPSRIQELVRSPHHHVIPDLPALAAQFLPTMHGAWTDLRFYLAALALLATGALVARYARIAQARPGALVADLRALPLLGRAILEPTSRPERDAGAGEGDERPAALRRLALLASVLLLYMLAASVVAGVARVSLIVQLTPYRMGVLAIAFAWIYLAGAIRSSMGRSPLLLTRPGAAALAAALALLLLSRAALAYAERDALSDPPTAQLLSWIRAKTAPDALFLNYSDIDIRTFALRSDLFGFKAFPLYDRAQVDWYRHLLAYADYPTERDPRRYDHVREWYARRDQRPLSARSVLAKTPRRPDYILAPRGMPLRDTDDLRPVFQNALYTVWTTRR